MLSKKITINYLFFGLTTFLLLLGSFCNIYFFSTYTEKTFFIFYSALEFLTETFLFIFLFSFFRKKIFVMLYFILFCIHLIDLILVRLLDLTFFGGINLVFHETFSNLLEMLTYSNISYTGWAFFSLLFLLIPQLGWLIYKYSSFKSIEVATKPFILFFSSLILSLFLLELHPINYRSFAANENNLPWKKTLLSHPFPTFTASFLSKTTTSITPIPIEKKPSIYLFIIESLRKDAITKDIAPNLFNFEKSNISLKNSFSNANSTPLSWSAILHSKVPIDWKKFQGSLPLKLFKEAGYKINVYSAAQFSYYNMGEHLFGKKKELFLDNFFFFPHYHEKAYKCDRKVLDTLLSKMEKNNSLNIIFFDSTHFEYNFPKKEAQFTPYSKEHSLFCTKERISMLKNRYLNAVHYVDSLFRDFFQKVDDDAIVIITGDHGEEFLEYGNMFHFSKLSPIQTTVPIIYKFGKKNPSITTKLTSHVDIFPTLFDYLFHLKLPYLDGESLFQKEHWPFVLTVRHNFAQKPKEFMIQDSDKRLIFRFKHHHLSPLFLETSQTTPLYDEICEKNLIQALTKFFVFNNEK